MPILILSPVQIIMTHPLELADKLYNSETVCFLCESMNFHPDKQLFQVAGAGNRTTDPWITKPELYLYTMVVPLIILLYSSFIEIMSSLEFW